MKELVTKLGKDGLKSAYSLLGEFALYLTLSLTLILVATFIVLKMRKSTAIDKFKTLSLGIVCGYAVTLSACIGFLMIERLIVKDEIDGNFYLGLGFLIACLVYALALTITKLINEKTFKICSYVGVGVLACLVIVMLTILPTTSEEYQPLSFVGMYVFSILLVLVIAFLTIFFGKEKDSNLSPTKAISYAGVSIALAFALSYVKLFSLPQGGSVTLASMLPLIIYSYAFGARKGVLACIIYGMLQFIQSPQVYQPMQVILDYPIAFGAIGVSGIVRNFNKINKPIYKFLIGATLGCSLRYVAHFLSGYYVFSSWAMEGYSALSWSVVYNLFVIVELAIILFVGSFLFSSKAFTKELDKMNVDNKTSLTTTK